MSAITFLQQLFGRPLPRRIADLAVNRYAQRRVSLLNHETAGEVQRRTLLRLLRYGRQTKFGEDHDFGRIRNIEDYQARVPLRDYEEFWKEYWHESHRCNSR